MRMITKTILGIIIFTTLFGLKNENMANVLEDEKDSEVIFSNESKDKNKDIEEKNPEVIARRSYRPVIVGK